jgi:hypothetical protein
MRVSSSISVRASLLPEFFWIFLLGFVLRFFFYAAFDLDDRVLDFAFLFFMKELLRTECVPWNERELDLRFR